tara:strand:+ start:240 stop:521 length:282 start_codon:yes stop_codon:yes gene_type:complete
MYSDILDMQGRGFDKGTSGDDVKVIAWVRAIRDAEFKATDIFMLEDYPISSTAKEKIKTYRAELRALPESPFPLKYNELTKADELDLDFWPKH